MSIITKKREALEHFIQELLESNVKDSLAKIYLFGSVAKGNPKKESDVDLLIFAIDKLDKVRDLCARIQLETYYAHSESVEALIYPVEDFRRQDSYFLYRVINHGQEVYSMEERR